MTPNQPDDLQLDERRRRRLPGGPLARGVLSLAMLAAIGSLGVLASQATFTDEVTMAKITVTGGNLDLTANGGDGPGEEWVGSISTALTGLKPGDEHSGTVVVRNAGDLPFEINATTSGVDDDGCYSYYLRETAADGATKAASWPVNLTGLGTADGADATMADFTAGVTGLALPDNGGDLVWETDDEKTYTMTVRMNSDCEEGGAAGTLDVTFNATQSA